MEGAMTCEKCPNDLSEIFMGWMVSNFFGKDWATYEPHYFCSLDCLSRWVEAQRPIAAVEERP